MSFIGYETRIEKRLTLDDSGIENHERMTTFCVQSIDKGARKNI